MKKTYTSDLTASQWQAIEKLISGQRKSVHSLKLIVEAIFYLTAPAARQKWHYLAGFAG